jgi:4-carboxymuconolactone decarboxylase
MARLPYNTRDALEGEALAAWKEIAGDRDRLTLVTNLLMYDPPMALLSEKLSHAVRFETAVPFKDVELVVLIIAREFDCLREWAVHIAQARRAGVSEDAIEAIKDRRAPDGLDDNDTRYFRYTRQLLQQHRVDDDVFKALHAQLGDKGIVDLTELIGHFSGLAAVMNAFEVEPPEDPDLLLPV